MYGADGHAHLPSHARCYSSRFVLIKGDCSAAARGSRKRIFLSFGGANSRRRSYNGNHITPAEGRSYKDTGRPSEDNFSLSISSLVPRSFPSPHSTPSSRRASRQTNAMAACLPPRKLPICRAVAPASGTSWWRASDISSPHAYRSRVAAIRRFRPSSRGPRPPRAISRPQTSFRLLTRRSLLTWYWVCRYSASIILPSPESSSFSSFLVFVACWTSSSSSLRTRQPLDAD